MKYGVTIYGPFVDSDLKHQVLAKVLGTVFIVEYKQVETVWQTMQNFPDFNSVQIAQRRDRDLVVHVYYSPIDVPAGADCAFGAKITPEGMYE